MSTESQLREKLRKIEALFAGAGTTGERLAAEAALERVRARLSELGRRDPPVEMQFSMPDQWSRHLFLALCRRYGLSPYRLHRQRRNTVMVRAPRGFVDQVLWPEFGELDRALQAYLHEVTPVFLYNLLDLKRTTWEGPELGAGKHTIVFDFKSDGPGLGKGGTGVLSVDGKEVARNSMEHTTPITFPEDETFDIGEDTRTGVALVEYRYDVPFKFTGKINKLTFKLDR
jgi:hypothetical protein